MREASLQLISSIIPLWAYFIPWAICELIVIVSFLGDICCGNICDNCKCGSKQFCMKLEKENKGVMLWTCLLGFVPYLNWVMAIIVIWTIFSVVKEICKNRKLIYPLMTTEEKYEWLTKNN